MTARYTTLFAPVQGAQRTAYVPRRRYSVTADIKYSALQRKALLLP
jgi:hypothetical protein